MKIRNNTTCYLSDNYLLDQGVIAKSNFQRYGGRIRIDNSISDQIRIGVNVSYDKSDAKSLKGGGSAENDSEAGIINSAFTMGNFYSESY